MTSCVVIKVVEVAERFSARLQVEAGRSFAEREIGMAFCEHMDAIKSVYVDVCDHALDPCHASPHALSPTQCVQYCCNFDDAYALLGEYTLHAGLKEKMDACQELIKEQTQAWNLESLLIKPVQRVLKYPLLLRELLALLPPTHVDHAMLQTAGRRMLTVASEINEGKRRKELVERCVQCMHAYECELCLVLWM